MFGSILLATSGHVDHGKSTLLHALTGVDPDRLPQEKKRGMTLDLGFAHFGGISFIDVPGHEDYLRHMISGVHDADGSLVVVSAVDGVQEQTLEHLRILKFLGHEQALFIITKVDLATRQQIEILKENLVPFQSLFKNSAVVEWNKSDFDQHEIIKTIHGFFSKKPTESDDRFFCDRAFSKPGLGTMVTGTLLNHEIKSGITVHCFNPFGSTQKQKHFKARIRSLEHHGEAVESCKSKARLSICLSDVEKKSFPRGSLLLLSSSEPKLHKRFGVELTWTQGFKIPKIGKKFGLIYHFKTFQTSAFLFLKTANTGEIVFPQELPFRVGDTGVLRLLSRIKDIGFTIAGCKLASISMRTSSPVHDKPEHAPQPSNESECALLHSIVSKAGWHLEIKKGEYSDDVIGLLLKEKRIYHVEEQWFISDSKVHDIINWLRSFGTMKLDLASARRFFGEELGRKKTITLLEFCDRHHWTFRKGNDRVIFRLP